MVACCTPCINPAIASWSAAPPTCVLPMLQVVSALTTLLDLPQVENDAHKELIQPAVDGTKNVLSSVAKSKDTVKRVILTSSVAGDALNKKRTTRYPGPQHFEHRINVSAFSCTSIGCSCLVVGHTSLLGSCQFLDALYCSYHRRQECRAAQERQHLHGGGLERDVCVAGGALLGLQGVSCELYQVLICCLPQRLFSIVDVASRRHSIIFLSLFVALAQPCSLSDS